MPGKYPQVLNYHIDSRKTMLFLDNLAYFVYSVPSKSQKKNWSSSLKWKTKRFSKNICTYWLLGQCITTLEALSITNRPHIYF